MGANAIFVDLDETLIKTIHGDERDRILEGKSIFYKDPKMIEALTESPEFDLGGRTFVPMLRPHAIEFLEYCNDVCSTFILTSSHPEYAMNCAKLHNLPVIEIYSTRDFRSDPWGEDGNVDQGGAVARAAGVSGPNVLVDDLPKGSVGYREKMDLLNEYTQYIGVKPWLAKMDDDILLKTTAMIDAAL